MKDRSAPIPRPTERRRSSHAPVTDPYVPSTLIKAPHRHHHLTRPHCPCPAQEPPRAPATHGEEEEAAAGGGPEGGAGCLPRGARCLQRAGGGCGGEVRRRRRQGVEPQRELHRLGEEAPALLQGGLARVQLPEGASGRGGGGRGGVREVRRGEPHRQLQQGPQLRRPARRGPHLLLYLQLRLLLHRHEARRHRPEAAHAAALRRRQVRIGGRGVSWIRRRGGGGRRRLACGDGLIYVARFSLLSNFFDLFVRFACLFVSFVFFFLVSV